MSDRERWTVYPLLFLALGVGLRSKFDSTFEKPGIECQQLKCHQLLMTGPDGKVCGLWSTLPANVGSGSELRLYSADGKPGVLLRVMPAGGTIETCGPDGIPQAEISATGTGGRLDIISDEHEVLARLQATRLGGFLITRGQQGWSASFPKIETAPAALSSPDDADDPSPNSDSPAEHATPAGTAPRGDEGATVEKQDQPITAEGKPAIAAPVDAN